MFTDSFQEKIWKDKYQYNDEIFDEFCSRIANSIFPNDCLKSDRLKYYIQNFYVVFGGRINSNIGIDESGLTLFNCFIKSIPENPDSLEGILNLCKSFALTLKSEGGVGFNCNFFRPSKTIIRKIGVTSPGPVKFLEIFDKVSDVITAGSVDKADSYQGTPTKSSIRKGATMVTMSVNHPDIYEFVNAKSVPNRLTKMNLSVLITDEFMSAVKSDSDFDLWFPDINFDKYDSEWNGDFNRWKLKGYPIVVYKTIKAQDLWNTILKSSHLRNDPGVIFIDNVLKYNNLHYLNGSILTTNPCGEVPGVTGIETLDGESINLGDVCCLGSLNLAKFYDIVNDRFNISLFTETVTLMVEALDNVIDLSNFPLEEYKQGATLKRKIGLGFGGVGSLLMMKGLRYGSDESISFLEPILNLFTNTCYKASALLAKEKGVFPLYKPELMDDGFVKNSGVLNSTTTCYIKKYGLRNSALMACAPLGTGSILLGHVSGGIEPVFATEFIRWNRVEGKQVNFEYPQIHKGEWFETDYFKQEKVADEIILVSKDGRYRIDKNTGLCEKVLIRDYGYNLALEHGKTEFTTATELSIDEHLNVLKLFSKYIDMSSSKTISVPNDISLEDFKSLYGRLHEYQVKGCTTYREGTSVAVLEKADKKTIKQQQKEFLGAFKNQKSGIIEQNVTLPEEYPAVGFKLKSDGKKWHVHVCFKDKGLTRPFAIFVNTNNPESNVLTFDALDKLELLAFTSGLSQEKIEQIKIKYSYQKNPVKICRMLGFLLRHNVPIRNIVKTLDSVEEAIPGTFVFRIKKFLAQFIEDYDVKDMICPDCSEETLIFSEGCIKCTSCGWSKCG